MILFLSILATRAHGLLSLESSKPYVVDLSIFGTGANPRTLPIIRFVWIRFPSRRALSLSHRSECPWKAFRGGYPHPHLNSGLKHTLILELIRSLSIHLIINTSFLHSIHMQHCSMSAIQSHCYQFPSRVPRIL